MIESNKKIEPVEFYSRKLDFFVTTTSSYAKTNVKLVQSLVQKWLNSQQRAQQNCKEFEDTNLEIVLGSVYIDLINEFISDLQIINNSLLNRDNQQR